MCHNGKIIRVTVEYENTTYIAEGKDAEDWATRVASAESLLASRPSMAKPFKWTHQQEANHEQ
jgi:hypothetical protein